MRIGINLLLWDGTITEKHVPVLEMLKEQGYDGVEFPVFAFDKKEAKKLRKHLDRLDLRCSLCTCVPNEANPISGDKKIRQEGLKHMKNAVEVSEILGADVIIGPFCSPVGAFVGRSRIEEEWKWAVEIMQKTSLLAEKAGIDLAQEAINRFETYFINTLADLYQFSKDVGAKNFGLMFDTFHANIEEENIAKALQSVMDKVMHVHISENNRGIPGTGHIRFPELFKVLKTNKYDRWLTIEAFGNAVPELAGATKIWRKMFESQEQLSKQGLEFIKKQWEKA